jgi:hypothetical protein
MTESHGDLYRAVHREGSRGADSWHQAKTVGFQIGYGFHSLIGAMYLQIGLYVDGGGEGRLCKRPDCYRLVTFGPPHSLKGTDPKSGPRGKCRTRKDKVFCSKACAQWWSDNYGNSKKAKRKR